MAPIRRDRALPALVAALACVLTVLAGPPADAARPGSAKWPWVARQSLQANGKVTVRLEWPKAARSKKYRISYAPLKGRLNRGEVSGSRKKRVNTVRRDRGRLQHARIRNLKPGTTYCFQVQGVRGRTSGRAGGVHCKTTTQRSRRRPPAGTDLAIGTFNTCSTACARNLGTGWETRGPLVLQRVREMRTGAASGRAVDVVAVQEGNEATAYLTTHLDGTFTRACQTSDGSGRRRDNNQALLVRDATWQVVPETAGGMHFGDIGADGSHGACWARIRSVATQREVVVVSLHLYAHSTAAGDRIRRAQTKAVIAAVDRDLPGSTVVFAGDFNSWRGRRPDRPEKVLSSLGYDDAFDPATSYLSHPHLTSHCEGARRPHTSPTWAGHLDRIFVPRGVHVASWKVDYRLSGGRYVAPFASDHNPVVVGLVLPG